MLTTLRLSKSAGLAMDSALRMEDSNVPEPIYLQSGFDPGQSPEFQTMWRVEDLIKLEKGGAQHQARAALLAEALGIDAGISKSEVSRI